MYMNQQLVPNWFQREGRGQTTDVGESTSLAVGGIASRLAPSTTVELSALAALPPAKRQRTTSPPHGPQAQLMTSFLHSLEKLVQDTHYTPNWHRVNATHPMLQHLLRTTTQSALSESARASGERVVLEEIPKAYEDSMMRPAMSDESSCSEKGSCECMMMGKEDPCEDESSGFVGVEFRTPEEQSKGSKSTTGMCLLCLRKQTMLRYYTAVANQHDTLVVSQPHRNRVGVGEYAPEMCIQTREGSFDGIVAPFVKHERHHYEYQDGEIKQTSHVNFREASHWQDTDCCHQCE